MFARDDGKTDIARFALIAAALAAFLWTAAWASVAAEPEADLLVGDPGSRAIYLLLDGRKRLVPDVVSLEALGFSLNDVRWVGRDALARIETGPNLLPFSDGDLIQDARAKSFYLLHGGKRAIADAVTLRACGLDPRSARVISSTLAVAIPDGDPFPDLRPGDLIRSQRGGCLYLLAEGRYWLCSEGTLAACGWRATGAREVGAFVTALIPERDVIPTLDCGGLLGSQDPADERAYVLDGGKHLIPDGATFEAYGWQVSRILRLPPAVLEAIPEGLPLARVEKGKNLFAYANWGQCTWYVAERRIAPSHRSARYWYEDAVANGFAVGQRPMPGAIIVYDGGSGRGIYGHVAYVEAVYADGSFARADSNICGWECVRTRVTRLGQEAGVLGFVYWKYESLP